MPSVTGPNARLESYPSRSPAAGERPLCAQTGRPLDRVAPTYISNDADYAATVPHVSQFPQHVCDVARDLIVILH